MSKKKEEAQVAGKVDSVSVDQYQKTVDQYQKQVKELNQKLKQLEKDNAYLLVQIKESESQKEEMHRRLQEAFSSLRGLNRN